MLRFPMLRTAAPLAPVSSNQHDDILLHHFHTKIDDMEIVIKTIKTMANFDNISVISFRFCIRDLVYLTRNIC